MVRKSLKPARAIADGVANGVFAFFFVNYYSEVVEPFLYKFLGYDAHRIDYGGFGLLDVGDEFFAVFGENDAFAVGACVGFYDDFVAHFLFEQVGDVGFVTDYSAIFGSVEGVAGHVNCFRNGQTQLPRGA